MSGIQLSNEIRQKYGETLLECLHDLTDKNGFSDFRDSALIWVFKSHLENPEAFNDTPHADKLEEILFHFYLFDSLYQSHPDIALQGSKKLFEDFLETLALIAALCGTADRLRDAHHRMKAGRSFSSDYQKAQEGDKRAMVALAGASKDWGDIPWFRKVLRNTPIPDRWYIDKALKNPKAKVPRRPNPSRKIRDQEKIAAFVEFYRPEFQQMDQYEIFDVLEEKFPAAFDCEPDSENSISAEWKCFLGFIRRIGLRKSQRGRPKKPSPEHQ